MTDKSDTTVLHSVYRERIGEPDTVDEVRGYWLFLLGLLVGIVGVVLFLFSSSAVGATGFTLREGSIVLMALGLVTLLAGPVVRLPLAAWANYAAYLGLALCVLAILWFVVVFPTGWSVMTGSQPVIFLYVLGLAVVVFGGGLAPLVAGNTRKQLEESERRTGELEADITERQREAETSDRRTAELEEELDTLRRERSRLESELEEARADTEASDRRAGEVDEELDELQRERSRLESELEEARADTESARSAESDLRADYEELLARMESMRTSQAQFELYEDAGGEYRWRLRHRNREIIASSGQGYTRKHNAKKGLASVRRNGLGATLVEVDIESGEEPEEVLEEVPLIPDAVDESNAEFELYEDSGGKYRWRLRHDNGNIIADSGEGYSSKRKAKQGIESVKANAGPASYLRFDPVSFEIYRDRGGKWRWRLVHKNGNILAAASEGYGRRRDAKRSVDSIRDDVADATERFEVYEDNRGKYRWRLRAENSEIVATSGQGYSSRSEANRALERVQKHAPEADALDIGFSVFEVYKDEGDEWRWRLRHRNGNIVADSSQGYASRSGVRARIESVKRNVPGAEVSDE